MWSCAPTITVHTLDKYGGCRVVRDNIPLTSMVDAGGGTGYLWWTPEVVASYRNIPYHLLRPPYLSRVCTVIMGAHPELQLFSIPREGSICYNYQSVGRRSSYVCRDDAGQISRDPGKNV